MSGDLEDFLRRAAQRRKAKAAQAAEPVTRPRTRPQYSNSRTERVARTVDPNEVHDEILVAELVESESPPAHAPNDASKHRQRAQPARDRYETAGIQSASTKSAGKNDASAAAIHHRAGIDLLAALRSPGGMRQAILLREILDRPIHRW